MSLERPSLAKHQQQVLTDVTTHVSGSSPTLRRGILGGIVNALAGALHGLYGWLQEYSQQFVPFSATGIWLERWAQMWGVVRKQPTIAFGTVPLTGAPGAMIPADTRLQSATGVEYSVIADVTLNGAGEGEAEIEALFAGKAANLQAGAVLSFISPLESVDAEVIAAAGVAGGADLETDISLRDRMLREIQDPPQGGSQADYERWALSVGPITRAWCFPTYNGPGSVRLYVINDDYAGPELASTQDIELVEDYINSPEVKPVGVVIEDPENPGEYINGLEVLAPVALPVNFTIDETPDDLAARARMEAAVRDLFRREAVPEGGIALNKIIVALGAATGVQNFVLAAPAVSPSAGAGEILTVGTFAWAA